MVANQENMEGDQPVQSHGHAQQPLQPQTCVQEHCPSETGFPLSVFHAVHEMCLVLLFKALTYPYPVWFYLEGNNAVSIKKGWIWCMWHNSFLTSLWTLQPTLVHHLHIQYISNGVQTLLYTGWQFWNLHWKTDFFMREKRKKNSYATN